MTHSTRSRTPETPVVLRGTGGSTGGRVGRARVAGDWWSCSEPKPGDVLVVPVFRPHYTPLLTRVAAVVVGSRRLPASVLVLSRELGVPCVVGVDDVGCRVPDGAWLRVDADARAITILGR